MLVDFSDYLLGGVINLQEAGLTEEQIQKILKQEEKELLKIDNTK